jgi:hypothetical protein
LFIIPSSSCPFSASSVVQQSSCCLGGFIVEVSRLHTIRHERARTHAHTRTQLVTHAHTQLVTRARAHTHTHTPSRNPLNEWSARRRSHFLHNTKKHKRKTSMSWAEFETVIPWTEWPQTYGYGIDSFQVMWRNHGVTPYGWCSWRSVIK